MSSMPRVDIELETSASVTLKNSSASTLHRNDIEQNHKGTDVPNTPASRSRRSLRPDDDEALDRFGQNSASESAAVSLPPMDGGFHAWAYLVSAWMLDFFIWALPFSYGVFFDHYISHDFKDAPSGQLAVVGSLSGGLPDLTSIIFLPILSRYPRIKRKCMVVGLVMLSAGLIGAAFATQPWQVILMQGIISPMGGALLWFPMMTFLFEWFNEKKGFANGVLFSGSGIGGVVFPFVINALLRKFGRKVTLISLAIGLVVCIVPCFPYLKPRQPVSHIVGPKPLDIKFMYRSAFWILFIANLIQAFGNFIPSLYLPTFATDMKLGTTSGTLAISLLNGASAPGYIFLGWLSDRFDLRISILLSSLGSGIAVLCIWGTSSQSALAPLVIFACTYGFLAQSWSALWPRFVSASTHDDSDPNLASSLLSIYVAGRGLGNVLCGPISAALLHPWALTNKSHLAYGIDGYGPLILFTGLTMLLSGVGIGYKI
ncbi:monocarboxylic acid transporter [Moniliophthora roreri MCA 2997]|uniref:Monocarboxylic acid transporter n=2 Tax=Moniliophthora roreri TaxID=221103 RepID=V2X1X2_MONRO|nr:monocarboxylic acid transporter [Moniliophthora roreri MCA 2997]KAI3611329.1 monocarboxylic acid transporter [Moniliophthora roreri]